MTVNQIYTLVNTALGETTGVTAVLEEDLKNLVDVGNDVFNANAVDNYCRSLVNVIGKTIFVNRPYKGKVAKLRRDGWEFGSVLRKIRVVPMEAVENKSWNLTKNTSYDPNVFTPAVTHEKFWNDRTTFEVDISLPEYQVKESFQSAEQMGSFISMIETMIGNVFEKAMENLSRRTLNNLIAETIYAEYTNTDLALKSGVRAINLLYEYKQYSGVTDITPAKAIYDPGFIRFAVQRMGEVKDYLAEWTKIYNIGGTDKHTPADRLNVFLLSKFQKAAETYLYGGAGQFKTEYVMLPAAEPIGFWQGSGSISAGDALSFESVSKINVKTSEGHVVAAGGILGVMCDMDAALITNEDRRVTSGYNPKGDFYNYFHKMTCQFMNDFDENCVVFFVA